MARDQANFLKDKQSRKVGLLGELLRDLENEMARADALIGDDEQPK
jgi:hypothetical protein